MTATAQTVDGLRVSAAEIARLKGVSRQAISKRLRRYVDDGLLQKDAAGKVSLAEWDTVTQEATDPARLLGSDTPVEPAEIGAPAAVKEPRDDSYQRQKARAAQYDADLKEIQLRKEQGRLLPIEGVTAAMARCAEVLVRDIDRLPAKADDLATAVSRNGAAGLREALKGVAREMREHVAANMRLLAEDETGDDEQDDD